MRRILISAVLIGLLINGVRSEERVLSRKRRYLSFPEGSSLQVIYDQTIPTIMAPLVFTIGVTVAIAYELPSKPWYEIAKKIKQNIKNGEYLIKKDKNASALTYVDTKVAKNEFQPQLNLLQSNVNPQWTKPSYYYQEKPTYYSPSKPTYYKPEKSPQISNKMDYYLGKYNIGNWVNKLGSWTNKYMSTKPGATKSPIYWSDVVKQFNQAPNRKQDNYKSDLKYSKYIKQKHKRPLVPVFGKRSIEDLKSEWIEKEANVFKNYHKKTRFDLYSKIEIYLNAKGFDGRACVLKTLCETGHMKTSEKLPKTFMAEIIKAIFRLPETDRKPVNVIHKEYELAYSANGNCSDLYPKCTGNVWSSHLLL